MLVYELMADLGDETRLRGTCSPADNVRRIELKTEITASVANTGAEQINDVSRRAEAVVYIVTVIYFRSNEKARFKKRALSCGV